MEPSQTMVVVVSVCGVQVCEFIASRLEDYFLPAMRMFVSIF